MNGRSRASSLLGSGTSMSVLKFDRCANRSKAGHLWCKELPTRCWIVGICLTLFGCGLERTVGGTGSETTNTIRVAVVGADGRPFAGARVLARTESDTTLSGARVFEADDAGRVDLPAAKGAVWLEARGGDKAALDVAVAGFVGNRRIVLAPLAGLRVEGLRTGQIVSLPGLGRAAVAGADGTARFDSLPSGVAKARWAGVEVPVPLPVSGTGEVVLTNSVVSVSWPSDGSLDSLAIRRFLDAAGLGALDVDSAATTLKGRLARLDLARRNLDSIPASVGVLDFLREVVLRGNHLRTLPTSFAALRHLDVVDLGGNPLDSVPAALRGIDSLRILELDSAGLSILPS
jgi:hypothetical protein